MKMMRTTGSMTRTFDDGGGGDGVVDDGGHGHDNGNASVRKASVLQGKEGS